MVPVSARAASASFNVRKRDMRPMDSTPTTGQKASSNTKKIFREAINKLRRAKAQMATSSPRQLNDPPLQLRLPHLEVTDDRPLLVEQAKQFGQPLLRRVHGAGE